MSAPPTRRALVALLVVSSLAFGGCLTLDPAAETDTSQSDVFADVSATESWSGPGVRTEVTLRSTDAVEDVTTLTVVDESGKTFYTTTVDPGERTLTFSLPAHQNVTLVASDSVNSSTVETLNVTTTGERVF
ncbi:hypothetical protein [Halogeometricum limi]|uniref:Uncharacterized protein n=1 Tax=Halogeometricum limi TaxID=555875 RepID=A0A1I6I4Y5_9EURY|nr:hypothetical protein [Halogeometricum limi]SFR61771.1 hypothetical protein SAMN04488124_2829 [Halogeometricum limi]